MPSICPECNRECTPIPEDQGIGRGECHGIPFNDIRMCLVSNCCNALLEESYAEYKHEQDCAHADYLYDQKRDAQFEQETKTAPGRYYR